MSSVAAATSRLLKYGFLNLNATSYSPSFSTRSHSSNSERADGAATFGFIIQSNENTTSSAVNGWPSENVTPWRSWNVIVSPSGLTCQLVASMGTYFSVTGSMY